jgi:MoaA/NifB/PqqE/SkfB family radical SAM enzyme
MDVPEVDTGTALAIVAKIATSGARRIVFTGGDPMRRSDIGVLVDHAAAQGLEVAISTTGDALTATFLDAHGANLDLVSLPLDGSSEEVSSRTKEPGHFAAIMGALDLLAGRPHIDVKVATPVTRFNLANVPAIVRLLDHRAVEFDGRLFYNVFQAFPRSMDPDVPWEQMLVSPEEFASLHDEVMALPHPFPINWLSHDTLDRLYVMVFPDGSLTVPVGDEFRNYGPFLDVEDLDEVLARSRFEAPKHRRHAAGWSRSDR